MEGLIVAEPHIVISADSHCGAELRDYKPYLDKKYQAEFDDWADFMETDAEARKELFKDISASVIDPQTVQITSSAETRAEDLLSALSVTWIIPAHRFQDNLLPINPESALSRHPIGTGPYKLNERSPKGELTMEAQDPYWDINPSIRFVDVDVQPDDDNVIRGATFNAYQLVTDVPPDKRLTLENTGDFYFRPYARQWFYGFGYNSANPALANRKVREAFTHAVNRWDILENYYLNQGEVIAGPFAPNSSYFDPLITPLPADPNRQGEN
jgi:ABC-type oligopeptide transport system substrate-binding subunit